MVCRAAISPGIHLKADFRNSMDLPHNFEIEVDFLVMRGVQIFNVHKRALPDAIRMELANEKYFLADPEQIIPGEKLIYIHGILGVKAISQLRRKGYNKVPGTEMTLCRSVLGDLLFGSSHFLPHQPGSNPLPLNDNDDWEMDHYNKQVQACSIGVLQAGLLEIEEEKETGNDANNVKVLQTLKTVENQLNDLLE
jgi:hypothetical protein